MGLEPVTSGHPFKVCAVAVATFVLLLGLARLFTLIYRLVAGRARRFVPRRVANVIGAAIALLLFWSLATNVVFAVALRVVNSSFQQFDALIEPTAPQPTSPLKAGSAASLLRWEELGRAGREFIASGPKASDISAASGRNAMEPIRVYVGLRAAETAAERAKLALEELKRTGAFERSTLIVITPTGTGWVDPAAMDSVEYLHDGDVASVAMQYSYLSSPLSLLVHPEYGAEAARALFAQVYDHWRSLPKDRRPKLYLHGLSLGAMNSQRSAELFEILGDPIHGALWSGPPFESTIWRRLTDGRNPGSPAWLPEFRDGSFVRFMNQNGASVQPGSAWGPMRIVYLQYASDAITFFDPRYLYRRPDWMAVPRGPDVSSELRWYPIVTMLQLVLDMLMANQTPIGYGHVFAPAHYVDAWLTLMDVQGWSPETDRRSERASVQSGGRRDRRARRRRGCLRQPRRLSLAPAPRQNVKRANVERRGFKARNGGLRGAQGRNRTTDTRIFSPLWAPSEARDSAAYGSSCRENLFHVAVSSPTRARRLRTSRAHLAGASGARTAST